ncbi:MAG: hypothetical protein LBQ12_10605 [Deltaproteobacteria bacterium]|jgi:hypothetical protein|nr:hypothetical protein [Deltaproteobacteria bacterium]
MPENSKARRKALFGLKPGALGLAAGALFISLSLCGAESVSGGRREAYTPEQFNHLELVASSAVSLLNGDFPPRTSPILTGGLGNPYHQFYAPFPHAFAGAAAVVVKDVVLAYSASVVLMLAFAFVFAFRLGKLLTGSGPCAVFAAFLYSTAPYLHAARTLAGSYDEYFALCLLPAALYYGIRSLSLKSYRHWALAALSGAAIALSSLWTALAFLFLCALYAAFRAASGLAARPSGGSGPGVAPAGKGRPGPAGPRRGNTPLKRAAAAASVVLGASLLAMYFLGPALLYDPEMAKTAIMGPARPAGAFVTPFLSLVSMRDTPWDWRAQFIDFSRYQAGLLVLASFGFYFRYCFRKGALRAAAPFLAVSALAFLFVARPGTLDFGPFAPLGAGPRSYRFLGLVSLAGTVAGALALKAFFASRRGFTPAAKAVAALALAGLSLALASPYLYPDGTRYSFVRSVNSADLLAISRLDYGETAFMRRPPAEGGEGWADPDALALAMRGRPGDAFFAADLEEYRRVAGAPEGEVLLDALYYPGLQEVEVRVNGVKADLGLATYWQARGGVPADPDEGAPGPPVRDGAVGQGPADGEGLQRPGGAFHGLKVTGAPPSGAIQARVRFTGMGWANLTSLLAVLSLAAGAAVPVLRGRPRKGPGGTGAAGASPAASAGGASGEPPAAVASPAASAGESAGEPPAGSSGGEGASGGRGVSPGEAAGSVDSGADGATGPSPSGEEAGDRPLPPGGG